MLSCLKRLFRTRAQKKLAYEKDLLSMPLRKSLSSNETEAGFFSGKNIYVMAGSFVTDDSAIGANTYIGFNVTVTKSNIGQYVSIANNVSIGPGEHDISTVSTSSAFYENAYDQLTNKETIIGHDVWIGENAIIRRGVNVGVGAVIGALSFVNQDVPPYAVVAGIPAKIIRYRFNESQIKFLEKSKWWELPFDQAKILIHELDLEVKTL